MTSFKRTLLLAVLSMPQEFDLANGFVSVPNNLSHPMQRHQEASTSTAFMPSRRSSWMFAKKKNPKKDSSSSSSSSSNDGMEDFEAARQAFERIAQWDVVTDPHIQNGAYYPAGNFPQPPPHHYHGPVDAAPPRPMPMTANVARMREMELSMLETLKDSDDAIDPLVELWVREREDAAYALHEMIHSMSAGGSYGLQHEERILRQMMDDYGMDGWVEPHGRLAVLLFTRGEYWETVDLCHWVLEVKPWHFEVAQLLVVTYLRMGEMGRAIQVARHHNLPPLHQPKRRSRWVSRATRLAGFRLKEAEKISVLATLDESMDECPIGREDECWQ